MFAKRAFFSQSGFTLVEVLVSVAITSIVLFGLALVVFQNTRFFVFSKKQLEDENNLLRLELQLKTMFRQALMVRSSNAGGEGWVRPYDSTTEAGLANIAVFFREAGRARNAGADSQIRSTGLFFRPPSLEPDGTEASGIVFVDDDLDGDNVLRPSYQGFFVNGLVLLQLNRFIESPVYRQPFMRLRGFDVTLVSRKFTAQASPRDVCFRPVGCADLAQSVDQSRNFTVWLQNNSFGENPFTNSASSTSELIYFFRSY